MRLFITASYADRHNTPSLNEERESLSLGVGRGDDDIVWDRTVPFLFQNPGEFLVEILSGSNVKNSQRFFLRVHRVDDAVRNAMVIEMVRSKPVKSSLQSSATNGAGPITRSSFSNRSLRGRSAWRTYFSAFARSNRIWCIYVLG